MYDVRVDRNKQGGNTMKNYFENVTTSEELKATYKGLVKNFNLYKKHNKYKY